MNNKIFTCPICDSSYNEEEWAKKCELWCREHQSCNLEIIQHSINKNEELNNKK